MEKINPLDLVPLDQVKKFLSSDVVLCKKDNGPDLCFFLMPFAVEFGLPVCAGGTERLL